MYKNNFKYRFQEFKIELLTMEANTTNKQDDNIK